MREATSAVGHCQWCCKPAFLFLMIGFGSDSNEEKANRVRFEELSLTKINIKLFWDVVTCSIAERYGHLEKLCCLTTLNLEAEVSYETSVPRSVPTLYSFSSQTTIKY